MRGAVAALVLLLLIAGLPHPAAAHLSLRSSQPADGAHLDKVPQEIRLHFSEPVVLAFTRLEVLGPDGTPVALAEPTVSVDEANLLVARVIGAMAPGPHTIVWRTTSADGHPVSGRIGFLVAEAAEGLAATLPEEPPAVSPVHHDPTLFPEGDGFTAESIGYVAVRWLSFIGLLGVIGVVSFKLLVLGLIRRRRTPEGLALLRLATGRSAAFGLVFSLVVTLAVLARLYAQSLALHGPEAALDGASLEAILGQTTWGLGWIIQAGATTLALVGFAIAWYRSRAEGRETREPHSRGYRPEAGDDELVRPAGMAVRLEDGDAGGRSTGVALRAAAGQHAMSDSHASSGMNLGWLLAALGVLVLAFTPALAGHAVATPERASLAVLSDGLHVLGAGGWLGSLLAVIVVGMPAAMRLGRETRGAAVAALVNAFSPTALFFAAVVTATGVLSASFHLGSVADLWQSEYGRTLLTKVGVVSLLFGAGAYNWRRVRPSLGGDIGTARLRRSAGFEIAVGVVVLLITAVLVATPPPMGMESASVCSGVETARG